MDEYRVQRESAPVPGVGRIVNPHFLVAATRAEAEAAIERIETFVGHSYAHGRPTFTVIEPVAV